MTVDKITVILDYNSYTTRPSYLLANVIVLRVSREGLGYLDSDGASPGNRQFKYNSGSGDLEFQIAGTQPVDAFVERVSVLFKY